MLTRTTQHCDAPRYANTRRLVPIHRGFVQPPLLRPITTAFRLNAITWLAERRPQSLRRRRSYFSRPTTTVEGFVHMTQSYARDNGSEEGYDYC